MGASHVLDPAIGDLNDVILELTLGRGADYVVECAGFADRTLQPLEACLAVNATLIDIGMGGTRPQLPIVTYKQRGVQTGRFPGTCRQRSLPERDQVDGGRAHRHAPDGERTFTFERSAVSIQTAGEPRGCQDYPAAGKLMEPDPILFIGGCVFLSLALVGRFDPQRLWRLFSLERAWRNRNPEPPQDWSKVARRYAVGCVNHGRPVAGW